MFSKFQKPHTRSYRSEGSNSRWKLWACATVLALLATAFGQREYQLYIKADTAPSPVSNDFGVYYAVGVIARSAHPEEIYNTPPEPTKAEQARRVMFTATPADTTLAKVVAQTTGTRPIYHAYPPFFAWAFSVFSHVKPRAAYFLWRGLSAIMLILATYLTLKSFEPEPELATFLIAAVGALSFFPFSETLFEGQVGCLILFLWTAGFYLLRTGRVELSAASFAAGTLIKVTPAIVVPLMILRRQWKWLFCYGTAGLLLVLASLPRMGWQAYRDFLVKVFPLISMGSEGYPLKSLGTIVRNLYLGRAIFSASDAWEIPTWVRAVIFVANLGLFAIVLAYLRKRKTSAEVVAQEFAVLAVLSLMISPLTWRHHYVLVLLPLLCAWMQSRDWAGHGRLALLSLITLALGTPYADFVLVHMHPGLPQAILSSAFLVASGLLLVLCMQDQRRIGQTVREPAAEIPLAA